MGHRYSTALSYLVLAGTGIFCFGKSNQQLSFVTVSYGIIIVNSFIGLWRWGNPDYGQHVEKLYRLTSGLQLFFPLPLVTAEIWLKNGYQKEYCWAHVVVASILFVPYLANRYVDSNLTDLMLMVNSGSLIYVSYFAENWYGIASALSYVINFFLSKDYSDVPTQDLYNYGMCFFVYFVLRAMEH